MAQITTWNMVTASSQLLVASNGYVANNSGTVAFQLPIIPNFGDVVAVTGINNTSGWKVTQNANQRVYLGSKSTTIGTGGYLQCTDTHDFLMLLCVFGGSSAIWNCFPPEGNITVV